MAVTVIHPNYALVNEAISKVWHVANMMGWKSENEKAKWWNESDREKKKEKVPLTCLFSVSVPSWPCRQETSLLCVLWDTKRTSSSRLSICGHTQKKEEKKNKKQKIKCSVIKLEQAKQVYRGRDQLTDLNKDEGNKCNGPFNLPVQQKQHRWGLQIKIQMLHMHTFISHISHPASVFEIWRQL